MEIKDLKEILRVSWDKSTCSPGLKSEWNEDNPAIGQCAITALIVNDLFGGKIMRCVSNTGSHYYNLIDDEIVDLTVEQFLGYFPLYKESSERSREYLLSNEDTKNRYLLLLNKIKKQIEYKRVYRLMGSDGQEYYSENQPEFAGNKKLKIYGKLDCPSAKRWLEKEYYVNNRVFFENEDTAIAAGYRPCGVCMKEEYNKWKKLTKKVL